MLFVPAGPSCRQSCDWPYFNELGKGLAGLNRVVDALIQAVLLGFGLPDHSAGSGVGLLFASSATMTNRALVTLSICGER